MRRKLIIFGFIAVLMAVLYASFHQYLTLETAVKYESVLRDSVAQFPVSSFAVGFAGFTLLSIFPGTSGKSLLFGWLFGFWLGLVQVNVGLTLAATISFLFSRYVFRDAIQSKFGFYLLRLNRALTRDGAFAVMTLRLAFAPYTFVNYALGATNIRTSTFWWSSQLGMLPGNIVFVLAGTQLPTLKQITNQGVQSILSPQVVLACAMMAILPFVIRQIVRGRLRSKHHADTHPST